MRIVCYFINYNDSFYIPFLAKHYFKFCEKIVMYDQYSTDSSADLAMSLGIEVRNFGNRAELNDQWYIDVKNNCWKECRGKGIDYVIVCDADEFVFIDYLKGSAPVVTGFNMISEDLPVNEITDIKTGEFSEGYSKQAIFSPDKITEIKYVHGCHKNYMEGEITTEGKCRLLHYRQIGGVQRIIDRHALYRQRMSAFNKKHNMAWHYNHEDNQKRVEWEYLKSNAKELW